MSAQLLLLKLLRHYLDVCSTLRQLVVVKLNSTALETTSSTCSHWSCHSLDTHDPWTACLNSAHLLSVKVRRRQVGMVSVL